MREKLATDLIDNLLGYTCPICGGNLGVDGNLSDVDFYFTPMDSDNFCDFEYNDINMYVMCENNDEHEIPERLQKKCKEMAQIFFIKYVISKVIKKKKKVNALFNIIDNC